MPMRFFLSITAFLWTMSIYFHFLPTRKVIQQTLTWAFSKCERRLRRTAAGELVD
jgi:hypothetical protein